jgi:hypothetical protein
LGGTILEVTIRPSKRGWCKPSRGAEYAAVSKKVFYGWLKQGLRHSRLANGRILTTYDAIDEYLERFEVADTELHPQDEIQKHIQALKGV